MMPLMPKQAQGFFGLQKLKVDRCLHPSLECEEKAIRAHSIQNASVLDLLQSEGHVVMVYPKLSMSEPPRGEFKKVGRNDATTFTGLCSKHDNEMFRQVDTEPLDTNSNVHKRQLVLRAAMKEFHTLIEASTRIVTAFNDQVKQGRVRADVPTPAGMEVIRGFKRAHGVFLYIGRILAASANPTLFEHYIIELNEQKPAITVSSLFSVAQERDGNYVFCTLNVVPVNETKTVAILSYTAAHRAEVRRVLAGVFGAQTDADKKKELSKLIIQRIENFVLAQSNYDGWSVEKKKLVSDEFNRSMVRACEIHDHEYLMLF